MMVTKRSLKRAIGALSAGALLLLMLPGSPARAHVSNPTGGGGGHEVPSPLLAGANLHVELADGEVYTIIGRVVFDDDSIPYIRVDLNKMPWLASATRKAFPLYRLEGEQSFWRKYEDTRVRFTCEAHGVIIDNNGTPQYVITLGAIMGDRYRIERP